MDSLLGFIAESLSVTEAVCMEPGCGESFGNRELLKIHTKAAHSFVFCETCGVSMLKKNLAAHSRKHEGGLELMRCPHPGCLHSYNKVQARVMQYFGEFS